MRALILVVPLLLAGCDQLASVTAPQADYTPAQLGSVDRAMCLLGFTAVPMRALLTGHHLVDARINGRPTTLLVDTGANMTVLHEPAARRLGLEPKAAAMAGAFGIGGALKAGAARIETLSLGPVTMRQERVMTADLSQVADVMAKVAGRPVDGIVGQDVLEEHAAVIDVAKPMLYLVPGDKRTPRDAGACGAPAV